MLPNIKLCRSPTKEVPLPLHMFLHLNGFHYLGIMINEKPSWMPQCKEAAIKANRMLGLLKCSLKGSHISAKVRAYKTLVRPLLEYTVQVWSPRCQRDINTLENFQRRATRWISGSIWDHNAHQLSRPYDHSLSELGFPTLTCFLLITKSWIAYHVLIIL